MPELPETHRAHSVKISTILVLLNGSRPEWPVRNVSDVGPKDFLDHLKIHLPPELLEILQKNKSGPLSFAKL